MTLLHNYDIATSMISKPVSVLCPFSVVSLLHVISAAIVVLRDFHGGSLNELQSFCMFCLSSVGGGTLLAIILGKLPLIFSSSCAFLTLVTVYAVARLWKRVDGSGFKNASNTPSFKIFFKAVDTVSSMATAAFAVTSLRYYDGVSTVGIACFGVLGAIGGSLASDFIGWKSPGKLMFSDTKVFFDITLYAAFSLAYYVSKFNRAYTSFAIEPALTLTTLSISLWPLIQTKPVMEVRKRRERRVKKI